MGRSAYRPSSENTKEYQEGDRTLYHRPSERYYAMIERNGQFYQRRHQIGFDGKVSNVLEERVDFVIGSGNHAHTYLHRKADGTLTELPVSWYAENGGYWAMSPGYDRPDQEDFRRIVSNECVFCHDAYPLKVEPGISNVDPATLGPSVQNGIGCQRCHGPGGSHVALAASGHASVDTIRSAIVNPARLDRDRQLEICMQCHLETTSGPLPGTIARYGQNMFAYRPGQHLGDYRIYFDRSNETAQNDRFEIAHAAYRLRKSACFRQSQMTCTTCHDPHNVPRGIEAVQHYVKVCRTCHAAVHSSEKLPGSCMDCHMPKRRAEDAVHVVMTDHFIQRNKPSRDLLTSLQEAPPLLNKYKGPVKFYYPPSLENAADNDLYLAVAQVQDGSNLQAGLPQLVHAIEKYSPGRAEFYLELGKAYFGMGEKIKAIQLFVSSLQHQPDSKRAKRELVAALLANGETARALNVLDTNLASGNPDPILLTNLGNTYLHTGKLALAERSLQQSLKLDPEMPETLNLLGLVRTRQGDKKAEYYFREALRFDPDFAAAHNNLANYLTAAGDYGQAGYEFEKAIASDQSYAEAHHGYGLLLELTHSYGKALAHLREAVRLDPKFALAHSDLGDLLAAGGHGGDAEEEYRLTVRFDPTLTEALFGLANVLVKEGKPAEAEAQLQSALKLNANYYEAHLLLAKLLAANGNASEAKVHFLKAAESPDPDIQKAARQELH